MGLGTSDQRSLFEFDVVPERHEDFEGGHFAQTGLVDSYMVVGHEDQVAAFGNEHCSDREICVGREAWVGR